MWLRCCYKGALFHRHRLFVFFSVCYMTFSLVTFKDYGITSDEQLEYQAGNAYLKFLLSNPADRMDLLSRVPILHNPQSSPYFRLYPAIVSYFNFRSYYEWSHLINLIFGYLCFLLAYLVVFNATHSAWSVLGPLLLFLNPYYFGHIPANPKDVPFATVYLLCLYLIIKNNSGNFRNMLVLGSLLGVAVGMRFVGITLFCVYLLRLASNIKNLSDVKVTVFQGFSVFFVAGVTLYLLWPYIWSNPLAKLSALAKNAEEFSYWNREILFDGHLITKDARPWYYLLTYVYYKTPLLILVGSLASALFINRDKCLRLIILVLVFNLVLYLIFQPTIYNEMRHFLYFVPLMTSASVIFLIKLFNISNQPSKLLVMCLVLTGILKMSYDFVSLHPYQYVYYSEVAGKMSDVSRRYEFDYWSASYKESAEYLRVLASQKQAKLKVYSCNLTFGVDYYSHKVFTLVNKSKDANYIICDYQNALINDFDLEDKIVYRVTRKGATLSYVAETSR